MPRSNQLGDTSMRNLLYAFGAGFLAFAILYFPDLLRFGESMVPAFIVVLATYFVLARKTFKEIEKIFTTAAGYLQSMPPKFELAISTMETARVHAPVQFGVSSQIDNQIGVMYFLQKQFNKSMPYLEKSLQFGHWMGGAMLAVIYYKKKKHDQMRETMQTVVKKAKKQSLAWNLYAYLLCQIGERDAAPSILIQALKKTNDDPKIKDSLNQLQNGKKIKMKQYKEQWFQFHLENPPKQYQQTQMGGGRATKAQRRGRW